MIPPEATGRLSLGRRQRLPKPRDFAKVRNEGQRQVSGCLIANWLRLPPGATSRVGVVTAKAIGGATIRSRARRLLRETFRLHQHEFLFPVDLVLVARKSIADAPRSTVDRDFYNALRRGQALSSGSPISSS
jgi:ribonuclease P protein component